MKPRSRTRRRIVDMAMKSISMIASLFGCFMLSWILLTVIYRGGKALDLDFFIAATPPPGEADGGMGPAILGTLLMTGMAGLIGIPIGMLAGVYLAEYASFPRFANTVRFCTDLLMGVPSIISGVFVYAIMVRFMGNFSAYAGGVSLAIIMIPVVTRTTEEMLRMVPATTREAALAMGCPRWRMVFSVLFRACRGGLLTGVLLAVARISGETAPLLFTSLNSPYWIDFSSPGGFAGSLNGPTANLTVSIFNQAMSPYTNWQQMAWGAALLITASVLALTIVSRFLLQRGKISE